MQQKVKTGGAWAISLFLSVALIVGTRISSWAGIVSAQQCQKAVAHPKPVPSFCTGRRVHKTLIHTDEQGRPTCKVERVQYECQRSPNWGMSLDGRDEFFLLAAAEEEAPQPGQPQSSQGDEFNSGGGKPAPPPSEEPPPLAPIAPLPVPEPPLPTRPAPPPFELVVPPVLPPKVLPPQQPSPAPGAPQPTPTPHNPYTWTDADGRKYYAYPYKTPNKTPTGRTLWFDFLSEIDERDLGHGIWVLDIKTITVAGKGRSGEGGLVNAFAHYYLKSNPTVKKSWVPGNLRN